MEMDQEQNHDVEDDPFLWFVDDSTSVLSPMDDEDVVDEEFSRPAWSWVVGWNLKTYKSYSRRVRHAILLSELSQVLWNNFFGVLV